MNKTSEKSNDTWYILKIDTYLVFKKSPPVLVGTHLSLARYDDREDALDEMFEELKIDESESLVAGTNIDDDAGLGSSRFYLSENHDDTSTVKYVEYRYSIIQWPKSAAKWLDDLQKCPRGRCEPYTEEELEEMSSSSGYNDSSGSDESGYLPF